MDKGKRVCKVCGKEYPYCKNWNNNDIFRWQDVACCEEHGKEYFAAVMRARGENVNEPKKEVESVEANPATKADVPASNNAQKDLKKNK